MWIYICIFIFLYIHILPHYKYANDLDIYEIDYIHSESLHVCDTQPFIFKYDSEFFDQFDAIVIDTRDWKTIEISYKSASELVKTCSHYISESEVVLEDDFLRPAYCYPIYHFCFGSNLACTKLQYHTYYRQFIQCIYGKIKIKMAAYKKFRSKDKLPVSDVNIWETNCLEFELRAGHVLYIPPYCWYSIQYESESRCCKYTYTSLMNALANVAGNLRFPAPILYKYAYSSSNDPQIKEP